MNEEEKKSGAPEENPGPPASAAPLLIGFAVCAVLLILIGWLTQP